MKTLIQLVMVAAIAGGISAAATIFTQKSAAVPQAAGADGEAAKTSADGHGEDAKTDEHAATDKPTTTDVATENPTAANENPLAAAEPPRGPQVPVNKHRSTDAAGDVGPDAATVIPEARVAVRPPYTPEGDEAGSLINLLRERSRIATETERRLVERQDVMQLIFDDLRAEQSRTLKIRQRLSQEMKESRDAVDATLQAIENRKVTEEALRAATEERDKLRKRLENTTAPAAGDQERSGNTAGSPEENVNLKKMAAVFDSMPAENVAKVFEQLVKNKRIDAVVALMNAIKDRQAAKVLAVITETNPELAADLTDRLKRLRSALEKPASE